MMKRFGLLLVGAILTLHAHAGEKLRYVLLVNHGQYAGEEIVERRDDGLTKVHHIFKDNGRGPELDAEYRLGPDGTFSEYKIKGTSTFGAPVDEHFVRKGNLGSWKSTTEQGSKAIAGTAFFVPLNAVFHVASASIAALAKREDGKLPLLPDGVLTQRKLDEVEVSAGGKIQRVQLLAQTGLGFTPSFYWATTGEHPRLFAVVFPGLFLGIEDGWQATGDLLEAHQKTAEAALLKEMAARLFHPLPGLTVVRNTRVFDSEKAQLGAASDVYLLRGRITAILPTGSPIRGADTEIEAGGRVMLPGLFDMHGHVDRWSGGLHLAAGVTTVRDMGNDNGTLQQMIDETASRQLLAPQIVPCGFLEGESPNAARNGFVIKDLQAAKDAVDWYAEHGYPQLKIYNSFPREILRDTVAYAHSRGMRVSGHVPAFMRAQEVVEQGFDELQHVNQVLLNFFVTPTTDTRTLDRFYLVMEKAAGFDFDAKPMKDFLNLLKSKQTVVDLTLTAFDDMRQRDGELSQAFAAVASHLPLDTQRSLHQASMKIPDDATAKRYEASYAKMVDLAGRMYRAGIPLVAGTDSYPGFALQRELELYVQSGLTPAQALQVATLNGAKYTRTSNDRGSITPGKLADLVLVDGDPTKDITDLRKVALVITQGKALYPSEVYPALGVKPFVEQGPVIKSLAKP